MSAMNFNTANQTFRQLLGNGLVYRVPPFQRDYSWGEDEWDDLWQDMLGLLDADGEPAHYMGYLVLQSPDSKRFDIIDGQQRLTTISVMILAALGHLKDLVAADVDPDKNQRRRDNLQNSYIGYVDPVSLVPRSKLELNRHNNRFYQTYLVPLESLPQRGLNASEHQLRKAFIWFKDKVKGYAGQKVDSGEKLASFIDSLVDKLFFTVITVTDELNAFKVFETLNARGVRLSATDLLKNYLFSVISSGDSHETELKALEERWERIVGLLGSESFPEFLRVYWNSKNRLVRKADLFKTIRRKINTREQAFELLRGLDSSAEVYAALRDPQKPFWNDDEYQALQQLLMFNVRQPLAMLLACYERFAATDRITFTRILRAVAVISFRYNVICNLQTHDQERTYNEAAWKITDGSLGSTPAVLNVLKEIYPDDRQFKAAFAEKELRTTNTRNRKVVRYILFQIERQQSGQDFDFESATYNLEHVLPESPSEVWSYIEEAKQDRLIYRLGNMTPLEAKENRQLGNGEYEKKREIYATSDFQITKAIAEHYDEWNESKIQARQIRLAEVASSIWRVDF
ncbi:DUF262 domain-containing protein [Geobacter grbiciae]|uniref:DUF262 domain-containing protein n=1 Tax=Geobacter grbiciae TaxID=155042 RepID=UPI001C00E71B|nr:DUF262 domain-containing protein [Geobacter grbiciae]MBT1076167.1 DUF262 domain-containing protein [Geobacter grbiciae]